MIEFGMNVTSYTACSINTVSVIRPPALLMPTSTTSESVTITTAKSTTVGPAPPPPPVQIQPQPPQIQTLRPFPVMPIIIKEEPVDYEAMSDITVETNTEAFEEQMRNHRTRTNGIHSTTSTSTSISASSNKSSTPLPVHSMVSVNTKSLLISAQDSTDSEFISAYMLTPSSNSGKTTTTTTTAATAKSAKSTKSGNKRKSSGSVSLAAPKSKTSSPQNKNSTKTNKAKADDIKPIKKTTSETKTKTKKRPREVDRLFDDSSIQGKTINESSGRKTRQQFKELQSVNGEPLRSRSRNGTPKADYKAFFNRRRTATPTTNGTSKPKRRRSVDHSTNHVKSLGVKSPNRSLHFSTENRARRKSVSHNRTRI